MSVDRIPLVGVHNQRSIDGSAIIALGYDQRFVNCIFDVIKNPVTGHVTVYVEKRPGWTAFETTSAGNASSGLYFFNSIVNVSYVHAFGTTDSTLYNGVGVNLGTITGVAQYLSGAVISGTEYCLIKSSDGTGWYVATDASTTASFAADTTNASAVLANISSTSGLYSGQALSGTGIPAGARILTVDSATQVTMTANATATNAGVTVSKTAVAKILNANFPSIGYSTQFSDLDGYVFIGTNNSANLYNSDLNSATSWTANGYLAAAPEYLKAVAKHKNHVAVLGGTSLQFFFNAGHPTGSPLSRRTEIARNVGSVGQEAVASVEDDVYFTSCFGETRVWRLRDFALQKISTPAIEKILGTLSSLGERIYMNAFPLGGYTYVMVLALPSSLASHDKTLVYSVEANIWSEWTGNLPTFVKYESRGQSTMNRVFATSRADTGGKLFIISPATSTDPVYTDDGSAYTMTIQTSLIDHGTDRKKFVQSVRLIGDTQASGTVTLTALDNDYATSTTLGTFDLTSNVKRITRCGSYRGGRSYKLTQSTNVAFRAQALEIEYTVGTA